MTEISYDSAAGHLSMLGHAGAVASGKDPVCAALSILMYTLADLPGCKADLGENGGFAQLDFSPGEASEAICHGFELMAENFPDCVRYERR